MNSHYLVRLGLLTLVLVFAGCSGVGTRDDAAQSGAEIIEGGSGAETAGAENGGRWSGSPLDDPANPLSSRKIYFDFDRSDIRPEYVEVLRAHAAYLAATPGATISIEGHCDERGSREYNIGLGERRANAVLRFLEAEGVNPSQLVTISYGEERPEELGHDEAAWSMNRRAVLVY